MNMQQILNDPELSKELDKAYELAAPYRSRVQYKLHYLQECFFLEDIIFHWPTGTVLAIASKSLPFIHEVLDV